MSSTSLTKRRLAILAAAAVLAVVLIVIAVPAGGSGDDQRKAVRETLNEYARAVSAKDYQRQCDQLLARTLVETLRSAGLPCEVALREGLKDVSRPTLVVRDVKTSKDQALARVATDAANQPPADTTIRLVKEAGGWRIASLAEAQPQPPENVAP